MPSKIKKRPNSLGLILLGGALGLPLGLFLSGIVPEDALKVRAIAGIVGISAPPTAVLYWSNKRWKEYLQSMLAQYEADKSALRENPSNARLRENVLASGRAYYSCMRDNQVPTVYDEQAISNDLRAILG